MSHTTIVSVIIALCLGGVGGYLFAERHALFLQQQEGTKTLLEKRLAQGNPSALNTSEMTGVVLSQKENVLVIDSFGFNQFSVVRDGLDKREVAVSPDTPVVRLEQASFEEMERRNAAFQEAYQDYQQEVERINSDSVASVPRPPAPPTTYTETRLSLADINPGMVVKVLGEAGILLEANPTAVKVILLGALPSTAE